MVNVPRLVVAAPSSGSGKTTVATGLMAAFAARGLAVSGHKVGPDYIDPGFHTLATGRPGRNLDAYMCGPDLIAPLFAHGAQGCGLAIVEGVMGLYDGASGLGELASTAHVAKLLRAPVVLVVDASSQSRSVAALVHGFASWDTGVRIGGVILNKVGSDRHEALLREALEESGVPVLGALRRAEGVSVPSRHLGLVPVAERRADAVAAVAAMAGQVSAGCDLEGLLALARSAPPLGGAVWDAGGAVAGAVGGAFGGGVPLPAPSRNRGSAPGPAPQTPEGLQGAAPEGLRGAQGLQGAAPEGVEGAQGLQGATSDGVEGAQGLQGTAPEGLGDRVEAPVVAVAGGAAFTFSYAENTELLAAAGAEVVTFDPLRDERLPEGTRGLVIGGGFPEVYAPELSANEPLRKAVAELAESGAPVAAECAGLLYLARSLDGLPMCGVLDAEARMSKRLTLGYRDAVALVDNVLAPAGARMRGHEFHRSVLEPGAGDEPAWGMHRPERRVEGFVRRGVHASYLHTHWASAPGAALRFVERCRG
ncbi:cobyrinate a,c-diamide synthase [Streptomyces sp. A1277]|uniref:cobyrinate a,c-diamide synthase n=1 Tax=Streptomyces sp. A1277 TaxID=2563103 RepID=UPI0010A27B02|nr:cobyrinate a,c-diamide synthase [Streptomyces sp. A1277]THA23141.1 cobyrinate a,c-diamide synthase [Streptomyces sp. A1277]